MDHNHFPRLHLEHERRIRRRLRMALVRGTLTEARGHTSHVGRGTGITRSRVGADGSGSDGGVLDLVARSLVGNRL